MRKLLLMCTLTIFAYAQSYEKVDPYTIKVTVTETKTKEELIKLKYLKQQKLNIEQDIATLQVELAKVDKLIEECGKLGITEIESVK